MTPAWMRLTDAAVYFGMARSTLWRLGKKNAITIHKPSDGIALVEVAEVEAWIKGRRG